MGLIDKLIPAIPLVHKENTRFINKLRCFDEERWKFPTRCPGWSVADIVSHMILGAQFYSHVILAGRAGKIEMPFGVNNIDSFWSYRDRVGSEISVLPGLERVEIFQDAVSTLQKEFEAICPEDMKKEAWHWMCLSPIHSYPGQRLYELILHDWDILDDIDAKLDSESIGIAVEILDFRLPFFLNNNPGKSLSGTFRFETKNPNHTWGMIVRDGHAESTSLDKEEFDVSISISASDIILLTTGRVNYLEKKKDNRLQIDGDQEKADTLMGLLCKPF